MAHWYDSQIEVFFKNGFLRGYLLLKKEPFELFVDIALLPRYMVEMLRHFPVGAMYQQCADEQYEREFISIEDIKEVIMQLADDLREVLNHEDIVREFKDQVDTCH